MTPNVLAVAAYLVSALEVRGWTLATAESCTGGLLSATLTSGPGVSAVFTHGFTCYSNLAKLDILGVDADILDQHGAVSEAVAIQMAEGAAAAARSDVGLGLTGIAGPGGATPQKPIGLVFGAICVRGTLQSRAWRLNGDRKAIREGSVKALLIFAGRVLKDLERLRRH